MSRELKLYVVGESSSNPEDWAEDIVSRALAVAESEAAALEMTDLSRRVAEVRMDRPCVLIKEFYG